MTAAVATPWRDGYEFRAATFPEGLVRARRNDRGLWTLYAYRNGREVVLNDALGSLDAVREEVQIRHDVYQAEIAAAANLLMTNDEMRQQAHRLVMAGDPFGETLRKALARREAYAAERARRSRMKDWRKLPPIRGATRLPDSEDGRRMVRCDSCGWEGRALGLSYHRQNNPLGCG